MVRREIAGRDLLQPALPKVRAGSGPADFGFHSRGAGLGNQLVLRVEMPVEPAMGQAGGGHQLAEAGGMDAVAAKFSGGGLDDPTPRFGGFELSTSSSGAPPTHEAFGGSHRAAVIVF